MKEAIDHNSNCSNGVRVSARNRVENFGGGYTVQHHLAVEITTGWGDEENVSMSGTLVAEVPEGTGWPTYQVDGPIAFHGGTTALGTDHPDYARAAEVLITCFERHTLAQAIMG